MASLNNLSVADLAMKLDKHLCNQTLDILKIVAILKEINRVAQNAKSNRHVKKTIERIEDADKSEQEKKTFDWYYK